MKIAVSGKGGTGKTTLSALLAHSYARRGRAVWAVDADPSPCLAYSLGVPDALREQLRPISEMEDLIVERTGSKRGAGGFFQLNPRVDDLPGRFSVVHRGVHLLAMGSVERGGAGCMCSENALLRALVSHLLLGDKDVLILDMHAGVEHLGRATVDSVDALLVVAEPTRRSLATAAQVKALAADIGLQRVWLVGNKMRRPEDSAFLRAESPGLPVLGEIPHDPAVEVAERLGLGCYDHVTSLRGVVDGLVERLDAELAHAEASPTGLR